jgi:hypothetical protein
MTRPSLLNRTTEYNGPASSTLASEIARVKPDNRYRLRNAMMRLNGQKSLGTTPFQLRYKSSQEPVSKHKASKSVLHNRATVDTILPRVNSVEGGNSLSIEPRQFKPANAYEGNPDRENKPARGFTRGKMVLSTDKSDADSASSTNIRKSMEKLH